MSASQEVLRDALGADEHVAGQIHAARMLAETASRESVEGAPVRAGDPALSNYLCWRIGLRSEEFVLALFLRSDGVFIAETLWPGMKVSGSVIPVRQLVRRAFDLEAGRVLIAHNHPSGNAEPSHEDISATRRFAQVLAMLEIALEDHCIVAGRQVVSMRDRKLY